MIEKENAEDIESGSDRAKSRYINEANQHTIEQLTIRLISEQSDPERISDTRI